MSVEKIEALYYDIKYDLFSVQWFQESPLLLNKNISVFDRNPFRILENPSVTIFEMMDIVRMFWN